MRQPSKRKGRSCIRPEVPRTLTWCSQEGVSQGQFCSQHIEEIRLFTEKVEWGKKDLQRLLKPNYDAWMADVLRHAKEVPDPDLVGLQGDHVEVKIKYHTRKQFKQLAQHFQLMDDFKDGVPRTAYRGIVSFRHSGHRVHLYSDTELYENV